MKSKLLFHEVKCGCQHLWMSHMEKDPIYDTAGRRGKKWCPICKDYCSAKNKAVLI